MPKKFTIIEIINILMMMFTEINHTEEVKNQFSIHFHIYQPKYKKISMIIRYKRPINENDSESK
jgi:hypothetical protein